MGTDAYAAGLATVARNKAMTEQRDALLAACEAAVATYDALACDEYGGTGLLPDVLARMNPVREAIAKAKEAGK